MKQFLIFLLAAALLCLCGCSRSSQTEFLPKQETEPALETETRETIQPTVPEGQLLCVAETREEAEEIAELYGIELIRYQEELAVYSTGEDPREVIRRGQENGWPELSLNDTVKLY